MPKGDVRAAGFTVKLGGRGLRGRAVDRRRRLKAHVIVDVTGYFVGGTSGSTFVAADARRASSIHAIGNGLVGLVRLRRPAVVRGRRLAAACRPGRRR